VKSNVRFDARLIFAGKMIRVKNARGKAKSTCSSSSSVSSVASEASQRKNFFRKVAALPPSSFMSPPPKQFAKRSGVIVDSPQASRRVQTPPVGSQITTSEPGFKNNGLTCFINATLAVLLRIPSFVKSIEQQALEYKGRHGADGVPQPLRALAALSSSMLGSGAPAAAGISTFALTQVRSCFLNVGEALIYASLPVLITSACSVVEGTMGQG
jgi:hypothetical protein